MRWGVFYHPAFADELRAMEPLVRSNLVGAFGMIEAFGPNLGRPAVDTLKGSRF